MKILTTTFFLIGFLYFGYSQNGEITESSDLKKTDTTAPVIYPNPSYGMLRVNLKKYPNEKFELVIKNIIGKNLWSETMNRSKEILDLGFLSKGSYLLSIKDMNGETLQSMRLVIIDP